MQNNSIEIERCATVSTIQKVLGGKWKIEILYYIFLKTRRFGELQRQIGDITQSTLTKQLRELESDGFISRYIYQEIPPKVEYSLTNLGKSFIPGFGAYETVGGSAFESLKLKSQVIHHTSFT